MARFALENTGLFARYLGGLIANVVQRPVVSLALLSSRVRQNVLAMQPRQRPLVRLVRRVRR